MSRFTVSLARKGGIAVLKDDHLLSIYEAALRLKVARMTFYRWIFDGYVKPTGSQTIGKKKFYWFAPEYIDEIRAVMPKGRGRGAVLLKDKDLERVIAVTEKWQKKAKV